MNEDIKKALELCISGLEMLGNEFKYYFPDYATETWNAMRVVNDYLKTPEIIVNYINYGKNMENIINMKLIIKIDSGTLEYISLVTNEYFNENIKKEIKINESDNIDYHTTDMKDLFQHINEEY